MDNMTKSKGNHLVRIRSYILRREQMNGLEHVRQTVQVEVSLAE